MGLTAREVYDIVVNSARQEDITKQLRQKGYYDTKGGPPADLEDAFNRGYADRFAKLTGGGTNTNEPKLPKENKGNPFVKFLRDLVKTQEVSQQVAYTAEQDMYKIDDVYDKFFDNQTGALKENRESLLQMIGGGLKEGVLNFLREETYLLNQINKETSLTGTLSERYRQELQEAQPELMRIGIGIRELSDASVSLITNTGRFLMINRETWKEVGTASAAYIGTLADGVAMLPNFEAIGYGASDAAKQINIAGKSSLSLGLNAKTIVKELGSGLDKMNEYGFKNGVQGLTRMIQLSKEFRIGLQDVYKIADKVMSPEGAIELSSNLQVLGGALGSFNDPLKLMYMATNDVEGLQEALIGASEGLASYNEEQGRFELTGANLRMAKARADALGVSFQDFSKAAIAGAEKASAKMELMSSGLKLEDEQTEFLTNLAQMKDGKMQIELQSEVLRKMPEFLGKQSIALQDLTEEQKSILLANQEELKGMTESDIIRNQATNIQNMERDVTFIAYTMRLQGGKAAQAAGQALGFDEVMLDIAEGVKGAANATPEFLNKTNKMIQEMIGVDIQKMQEEKLKAKQEEIMKKTQAETEAATATTKNVNVTTKSYIILESASNLSADQRTDFMIAYNNNPKSYGNIGVTEIDTA